MADISVTSNPQLIVADDTDDNTLVFDGAFGGNNQLATIVVTVGTFRFAAGTDAGDSDATYTVGAKLLLSFNAASRPIHFKASSASDAFKIAV
jgi:hypothetical protein